MINSDILNFLLEIKFTRLMALGFMTIMIVVFTSCQDCEDDIVPLCNYQQLGFYSDTASESMIPINTKNFWVYSDSSWNESGEFDSDRSTLIQFERIYDLGEVKVFVFSAILPPLALKSDTLFNFQFTPEIQSENCYDLLSPYLFQAKDLIVIEDSSSLAEKVIFPSSDLLTTPAGDFSNNIIYQDGDFFEIIANKEVGILKISFFILDENNQKKKRRILTLTEFGVVNF